MELMLRKLVLALALSGAWALSIPAPSSRPSPPKTEHDEQQMHYMQSERVILVDTDDRIVGAGTKADTHLVKYGPLLHRAFSVFLFDTRGRMLLQRRAAEKITFPDHWTNTCCSHPLYVPEEMGLDHSPADQLLGVKRAAIRKLEHELGIQQLPLESLMYLTRIHYLADSDPTWGEHEIDYVSGCDPSLHAHSHIR